MKAFRLVRPRSMQEAAEAAAKLPTAALKAGGVDLLDRMKERVDEPDVLIGLGDVADGRAIRVDEDGGITLGALATLSDLVESPIVERFLPALHEAASQAASLQIRNRATLGGNLAQGTRCGYWRHRSFPCLKRGDDHCPVRGEGGVQDAAGIFANEPCASAHPSSLAPVLGALGAQLELGGRGAARRVEFEAFWQAPEKGREAVVRLGQGELILAVRIPARARPLHAGYAEVRQRAAFDWPLVSCAVGLEVDAGTVSHASVWLGSVAPTPHHARAAELALIGHPADAAALARAGAAALSGATPLPGTNYKLKLVPVVVRRALEAALRRV